MGNTLKLRPREAWWHCGTKEVALVGKLGTNRLPDGVKPPLMLASEDEVSFRLEAQNQIAV